MKPSNTPMNMDSWWLFQKNPNGKNAAGAKQIHVFQKRVKEDTGSEGLKGKIRAATFIVANILSSIM